MTTKRNFTFLKLVGRMIANFSRMLDCWYVFLIYGVFLTLLSMAFGRYSYTCFKNDNASWCFLAEPANNKDVLLVLTYYLLWMILFFFFSYDICRFTLKNSVFKIKDIFIVGKEKIKTLLFWFAVILCLVLPLALASKIILQPAYPDWRIEFLLFCVVFILILLTAMILRLSAFIGHYLTTGQMPLLPKLYKLTISRSYIPIILFLLLLVFLSVGQLYVINYFRHLGATFLMAVIGEYADTLYKLLAFGMFLAFFRAQDELLQQDDIDPKTTSAERKISSAKKPKKTLT